MSGKEVDRSAHTAAFATPYQGSGAALTVLSLLGISRFD